MNFRSGIFLLLLTSALTQAQVFPSSYFFTTAELVSVYGSSATGNCSNVTTGSGFDGIFSRCNDPTSSVLFDGIIPILTGLDGNMSASQLLTLQRIGSQVDIIFDFSANPTFVDVERVELVMFNCPELGISAQTILVRAGNAGGLPGLIGQFSFTDATSCDSLVRLCLERSTTLPEITLQFFLSPDSNWVHLAEVTFITDVTMVPACTQGPITTIPDTPLTTMAISTVPEEATTPPPGSDSPSQTTGEEPTPPTGSDSPSQTAREEPTPPAGSDSPSLTTREEPTPPTGSDSSPVEACPSCSTSIALATVLTAIGTALLATAIFVLVQIAVCKYHPKYTLRHAVTEIAASDLEGQEYEQVDVGEGGVAVSDPTYMEVGGGENTFQLKENEAYATHHQ